MNLVRRAVLNGKMDTAPVDLRTWTEQERPEMDPPYRDYQYFWCPQLNSPTLFWYKKENMEEEIYRYPAVLSTENFFDETEDGSCQTDGGMDDNMEGSEWFQSMGQMEAEYFWELLNGDGQTGEEEEVKDERSGYEDGRHLPQFNMEEDGYENESDNEDWRQPPSINTMGHEWFYE